MEPVNGDGVPVAADTTALRRARATDVRADGSVKKAPFLPRTERRDADGLSVSIERADLAEIHRQLYVAPNKVVVSIEVNQVRALSLDVIANPTDADPSHALITGIPDRETHLAECERKAEELAERARLYQFPEA